MKKTFRFVITMASLAIMASCSSNTNTTKEDANDITEQKEDSCVDSRRHHRKHEAQNLEHIVQHRADRLAKELDLTDEQKQKVVELMTENATRLDSTFKSSRFDRNIMRQEFEKEETQIKSILTKEQIEKYDEMKEKMIKRHERHERHENLDSSERRDSHRHGNRHMHEHRKHRHHHDSDKSE